MAHPCPQFPNPLLDHLLSHRLRQPPKKPPSRPPPQSSSTAQRPRKRPKLEPSSTPAPSPAPIPSLDLIAASRGKRRARPRDPSTGSTICSNSSYFTSDDPTPHSSQTIYSHGSASDQLPAPPSSEPAKPTQQQQQQADALASLLSLLTPGTPGEKNKQQSQETLHLLTALGSALGLSSAASTPSSASAQVVPAPRKEHAEPVIHVERQSGKENRRPPLRETVNQVSQAVPRSGPPPIQPICKPFRVLSRGSSSNLPVRPIQSAQTAVPHLLVRGKTLGVVAAGRKLGSALVRFLLFQRQPSY